MVQDSTSRHSILQAHQFQWQFYIHSTLLRSSNWQESRFLPKEFQFFISVSHAPFICISSDQGLTEGPGIFIQNKDSMWQIQKATRNKFYIVYIDYGLIQVSFFRHSTLKKGICCNIDQIRIYILPL